MACCPSARRKAITKAAPLPGSQGWTLIEFRGLTAFALPSRTTKLVYQFKPGGQIYVDAYDVPMLLLWRENDKQVFFEVDE